MSRCKYLGAIHIHTRFSDGTGDVDSISNAAKKAGLSWIIITDHNSFDIKEGFYNGVCVIKGEELSPPTENHYLALGIDKFLGYSENPEQNVQNVRAQGGFGIVAHPDESLQRKNNAAPIRWHDKSVVGDGIEIWNWFSDWADNYDDTNIFKIAYSYVFRENLIKGAHLETLKWWDEVNKNSEKIIPAVGGVDAHALKVRDYFVPVTIFPYKYCFETTQNLLSFDEPLPIDFSSRKAKILDAIRNGKNIIINGKSKINPLDITIKIHNTNSVFNCGETLYKDENTFLTIDLPKRLDVKIVHDGEIVFNQKTKNFSYKVENAGKYRVEVFDGKKPCIYSNPIQVF